MRQPEYEDFEKDIQPFCHDPKPYETKIERCTATTVNASGQLLGVVSGEWDGKRSLCFASSETSFLTDFQGASPAADSDQDSSWVVYIQFTDCWQVSASRLQNNQVVQQFRIHASEHVCMQPAICCGDSSVLVTWVEEQNKVLRIQYAQYKNDEWSEPQLINVTSGHCFRPAVCRGDQWLIVFDRSDDDKHCLEYTFLNDQLNQVMQGTIISDDAWLYAPVCGASSDRYMIACLSQKLVIDPDLEIVDHDTGLGYCEWADGAFSPLVRVADLNDGLLGEVLYTPYFGIRRRCHLVVDERDVWLFWEGCPENQLNADKQNKTKAGFSWEHYGHLLGLRKKNEAWEGPVYLHRGGIQYSVASSGNGRIAVSWIDSSYLTQQPELRVELIDLSCGEPYKPQARRGRWKPWTVPKVDSKRYSTVVGDETLKLYWADTHVHSRYCPDAEGEPDLLVQTAREQAQIDFMCIIDNDFYPYAGIMPLEWERLKTLAALFSKNDNFILLPGYEYTYHEKGLEPNFNHRYVMYPSGGEFYSRTDPRSRTLEDLAPLVDAAGGILVAHHPTFRLIDHPIDHYTEICSSWRISMEEKNEIRKKLRSGQKLTFIGSSDTHRALPGLGGALTGVYATSLDPDALFEGYRKGRTIATQGNRTVIDFRINEEISGASLSIPASEKLLIHCVIRADRPIEYAEIICDESVIRSYRDPGLEIYDQFSLSPEGGTHTYYVRVKLIGDPSFNEPDADPDVYSGPFVRSGHYPFNFARVDGPFAWSTPVWVTVT